MEGVGRGGELTPNYAVALSSAGHLSAGSPGGCFQQKSSYKPAAHNTAEY